MATECVCVCVFLLLDELYFGARASVAWYRDERAERPHGGLAYRTVALTNLPFKRISQVP